MRNMCPQTFKMILAILLVCSLLLTVGCSVKPDVPPETQNTLSPETTAPADTTAPTETVPEEVVINAEDLRQAMEGSPQLFAVAYFGFSYCDDSAEVFAHMENMAPNMCQMMPFLTQIPEERILGEYCGELYCIVPADPKAKVTVTQEAVDEDGRFMHGEVVYSDESGEPILMFCDNVLGDSRCQLSITDSFGNTVTWYPQRDGYGTVSTIHNDNRDSLLWDFTNYADYLASQYSEQLTYDWSLPEKEDLVGKTWGCESVLLDGRKDVCLISFSEDTVYVRWVESTSGDEHEFSDAEWELTHENGFAVLSIDFREFAGILRYNLLYDREYGGLYTIIDVSAGNAEPGYEPLWRYLDPRDLDAPDPVEMVGFWERFRWETDGYSEEDSGTSTIEIAGDNKTNLTISYTDKDSSHFNYYNKPLTVMQGVVYSGCGNDLWLAEVDHVGPWDTTYTVTLLKDGTLLVQNYYLLDGAPSVSYEWFRRVS